jgi:hypothetical protein
LKKQFTLTRASVAASDPASLAAEILAVTGNEGDTASVLRSLARLGTDESITEYKITHNPGRRANGIVAGGSWRVHAERAADDIAGNLNPESA